MGFQFAHIETYGRKADKKGRSVGFVLDEAERKTGACEHVKNPAPPTVVHGISIAELRARHDAAVDAARVTVAGKPKKIRVDQHSLLTVIASHPATSAELRESSERREEVEVWQQRTLNWLRERYGDNLVSVIRHDDEAHPHLHAYVLPKSPEMKARDLHDGVVAKAGAKILAEVQGHDPKAANKLGDDAYRDAMRRWQDSYWQAVGLPCGLTRLGPGRRRLDRAAWRAEKDQVTRTADLVSRAERAEAKLGQARDVIREAKAAAAAIEQAKREAEAAKAKADAVLRQAREKAEALVRKAKEREAQSAGIGRRIASAFLGVVGLSPRQVAAKAAKEARETERARLLPEVERAKAEASKRAADLRILLDDAKRQAEQEARARAEAERRAAEEARQRKLTELELSAMRGRWADADNRLQEVTRRRGPGGPGL